METHSRVRFYGVEYEVDLRRIRQRMVAGHAVQVGSSELPAARGIRGWAREMGVSHMTLRRLLQGHGVELDSLNRILAALRLSFDEVCRPVAVEAA